MYEENKECHMKGIKTCSIIIGTPCGGEWTNEAGKCPFYKDDETYRAGRRKTHHRLKRLGLEHLLGRRAEK